MKISILKSTLLAAAVVLCSPLYARAAVLGGSTSGIFGTPSGSPDSVFSGVGTSKFTSGSPIANGGSTANILEFAGRDDFSAEIDTPFTLGELFYTNGITTISSNVDAVPLEAMLKVNNPFALEQAFEFQLAFDITPNQGNDPIEDADRLIAQVAGPGQTFDFDGRKFTLELLGFSQDQGQSVNNTFFAFEEAQTSGLLIAQITEATSTPGATTPEPLSILGLGAFGAIAGLTQRKRSTSKA